MAVGISHQTFAVVDFSFVPGKPIAHGSSGHGSCLENRKQRGIQGNLLHHEPEF